MDMSETGSGVASLGKLIALQKLCEERLRRPSPSTQCLTFILEHALSLAVSQVSEKERERQRERQRQSGGRKKPK